MEFWGHKVPNLSPKWENQMEETKCQNVDQFTAHTLMKTVWVSDPVIKGLLSPNNSWSSSTGHLEDSVDFGRPNEWRWRGIDEYAQLLTQPLTRIGSDRRRHFHISGVCRWEHSDQFEDHGLIIHSYITSHLYGEPNLYFHFQSGTGFPIFAFVSPECLPADWKLGFWVNKIWSRCN